MKNRYDKVLLKGNKQIISLSPANETLRLITAFEFKNAYKKGMRVLEIGCGEGDSAKVVLENVSAKMDLLDISSIMINNCKNNLSKYEKQINYICSDSLEYLDICKPYDIIFSSWTIHNFPQKDKKILMEAIYKKLNKGGVFILMDKIYLNKSEKEDKDLLNLQLKRHHYLEPVLANEIIAHEKKDYSKDYKMNEKDFIKDLKKIGFKKISVADRVERDIVLVASR